MRNGLIEIQKAGGEWAVRESTHGGFFTHAYFTRYDDAVALAQHLRG